MASMILTIIGPDRPGLIRALSEAVASHGGSWLESRMAYLAGQFAGIVLVESSEALGAGLQALECDGLRITVTAAGHANPDSDPGRRFGLEVVANDRPGIVRDVANVLATHGVNIEELTTDVASGAFSGEALFRARIAACIPTDEVLEAVRAALERLGDDMMVDIRSPAEVSLAPE